MSGTIIVDTATLEARLKHFCCVGRHTFRLWSRKRKDAVRSENQRQFHIATAAIGPIFNDLYLKLMSVYCGFRSVAVIPSA
jgi:hypothetical protein